MAQHCPKQFKMVPNDPQLSTMTQHSPKWSNMVPDCPIIFKMVLKKMFPNGKNGSKMFNMVLNGVQCSQMVLNDLKMDHKFNWIAFITRFNLVLVWSKIVQMLTNKSSKWVRHNQVSWSSISRKYM